MIGEFTVINEGGPGIGDIYAFGVRNDGAFDVFDDYGNWTSKLIDKSEWDAEFVGGIGPGSTVFSGLIGGPVPPTLGDFDSFSGSPKRGGTLFGVVAL